MNKYIYILLSFFVVSCVTLEYRETSDLVPVAINLTLDEYGAFSCVAEEVPDTRVIHDIEGTVVTDHIHNMWVIQFSGNDDEAELIGTPEYISDIPTFFKPEEQGGQDGRVKLVASSDISSVIVLANTFDNDMSFAVGMSLGELKLRLKQISNEDDLFSTHKQDKYLIFSAMDAQVIAAEGTTFNFALKRNVAKVEICINNKTQDVSILSWQLRSVSSVSYFFNNYSLPDIYPAVGAFEQVDFAMVDPEEQLGPGETVTYNSYLPVNKWDVRNEVTNEAYKNSYAPEGATYLQINAICADQPLTYKFYLGGNMTTDFSLLPNTFYSYTFDINSKGDAENDSRVEYPDIVDFSNTNDETANCYIINPDKVGGVRRTFRIPVKRVDEFWGGKGYENIPANALGSSSPWVVDIIATNFDNSAGSVAFTKKEGIGSYDASSGELQYFEFTVAPGTVGNAIVALRKAEGSPILWSWHLWITDYSPDAAYDKEPQSGVYSYPVPGGVVHRYEGEIWHDEYAKRFIMDRNLGAWSVNRAYNDEGVLYYQYGRKDPTFNQHSSGKKYFSVATYDSIMADGGSDAKASLIYSIHNPLSLIYTSSWGAWTIGHEYNPTVADDAILWMDPMTSTNKYYSLAYDKSIFDPCPPGYCLPKISVWSDFRSQREARPTTNVAASNDMLRGFPQFNRDGVSDGCYYWPYPESGSADNVPANPVFYPAEGIIQGSSGWSGNDNNTYCLSVNQVHSGYVYMMSASADAPNFRRADIGMNLASPVRCITSRDAE